MKEQFRFVRVDAQPVYLQATYQLRYAVYCREKKFLPETDYPDRLEIDAYDSHSLHIAAIDHENLVKGTARLVYPKTGHNFPLTEHCRLDEAIPPDTAEISRVAISKRYRQRIPETAKRESDSFGLTVMTIMIAEDEKTRVNRLRATIIFGLYRTLFQESKRFGIKHWLVAMEPTLSRLLARRNFNFRQIGPEIDYYGPVAPYLLSVSEFEGNLAEKNPELYAEYIAGV